MNSELATDAAKPELRMANTLSVLKSKARRGVFWVAAVSAVAVPLAFYRNWILGRFSMQGEVAGQYASILLFIQVVTTFFLFGGSSVTVNFLPKIHDDESKSAFICTYTLFSMLISLLFAGFIFLFPESLRRLLNTPFGAPVHAVFIIMAPVVVLAKMVSFSLAGLMEFRVSSLLTQFQVMAVCVFATVGYFTFHDFIVGNTLLVFGTTICIVNAAVFLVGVSHVVKKLSSFRFRIFFPTGFWRFSGFTHLNTFATFASQSIDQLFVLSVLGIGELGSYYILSQCAQLIVFVPRHTGQVLLASFSRLVSLQNTDVIRKAYTRICRLILITSTPMTLSMILFSRQIAGFFGEWYAERHGYLIFLAVIMQIGSLGGSINSMLVLAKERTVLYLANNLGLIALQFAVTIPLIHDIGVYAVIAGRAAASVSAQAGLFAIIRWKLGEIQLSPPREYWISLIVVLSTALAALLFHTVPPWTRVMLFVLISTVYFRSIRFQFCEISGAFSAFARRSPEGFRH